MKLLNWICLALGVCLGSTGVAQAAESGIQELSIASDVLEQERTYFVRLPDSYEAGSDRRYPTLYLLDGEFYTQHLFSVSDLLASGGLSPEFILVGLAHEDRIGDLTPTEVEGRPGSGGADSFLVFLETELRPHIDRTYRTNGFNILAGHSFGGLFVLHTLQARPGLFQAHFAFSPSLYWDEKTTVHAVQRHLPTAPGQQGFLYMNMGNEGLDDPYEDSIAMREGFMELVDFMESEAPRGLRFASDHMEQEYHISTITVGPFHALRALYRRYPLPTATIKQGLDAILAHYLTATDELGFPVTATLGRMHNAGMYHLWANEDLEKGIEILEYNVGRYPESVRAHDGLSQLYEASGQLEKALEHVDVCLALSEPGSEKHARYEQRGGEITARLNEVD